MLAVHPDVESLHEVFTGLDWGRRFVDHEVTGTEVAALLATPNPVTHDALSRGYTAEDFRRVAHRIDAVLRTLSPAENAADKRA